MIMYDKLNKRSKYTKLQFLWLYAFIINNMDGIYCINNVHVNQKGKNNGQFTKQREQHHPDRDLCEEIGIMLLNSTPNNYRRAENQIT